MSFIDTSQLEKRYPLPGWSGRFINSENMTFVYWDIEEGAQGVHEHEHIHEEVWHVLEGEIEVTIEDTARIATPGYIAIIPPNTRHSVRVLSKSRVIVADYPLREAFGQPTQA